MENIMLHIVSRSDAKARGLRRYFNGKPCTQGHLVERNVGNKNCIACCRARDKRRTSAPEFKAKRKEYDRARWENDREYLVTKNRRYYAKNADAVNEQKRGYWRENRDAMSAAHKLWVDENRSLVRHLNRLRIKKVKRATPPWADLAAIRAVYDEAGRLSIETGVAHHVDHVVPLTSDVVCGLHVHFNLRAIPWDENVSKKNRFVEDLVAAS